MAKSDSPGIERLVRPHLGSFVGYSAATSPDTLKGKVAVPVENIVKLDANENPYGCSPRVNKALAKYPYLNIYPDARQTELRRLLSVYAGAPAERIVAAGGSNQLLDLVVRLFVGPGDEVINCVPTFDLYRFSVNTVNGSMVEVLRDEKFAVDVEGVISAITPRTKLIVLANPNNPTGNAIPHGDILPIADSGLPLIIDEAYYEFSGETVVPLVERYPNLMVIRTFSKWAGLAGLRVGYGIFPPKIAEYLQAIKIPYNVNVAALVAVRESLADLDYLTGRVKAIIAERHRVFRELQKVKYLKPYPSRANFIFCSVLQGKASELHQKLQDKGILVRYFDRPLLRDSIRISVGKPEHTDALIKVLLELGGRSG